MAPVALSVSMSVHVNTIRDTAVKSSRGVIWVSAVYNSRCTKGAIRLVGMAAVKVQSCAHPDARMLHAAMSCCVKSTRCEPISKIRSPPMSPGSTECLSRLNVALRAALHVSNSSFAQQNLLRLSGFCGSDVQPYISGLFTNVDLTERGLRRPISSTWRPVSAA